MRTFIDVEDGEEDCLEHSVGRGCEGAVEARIAMMLHCYGSPP